MLKFNEKNKPEKVNLAGLRILVVEDGDDNQEIFRRFLEAAHGRVSIATSGKDAIELFPSEAFDLILMDIQLPEINGYETTREIRKRGFPGPILAVTANAMKGERERCLAAQCDDYLSKPVNFERLFKMIQKHCQVKLDQDQQVILSDYQDDPRVAPLLEQYAKGLEDKVNRLHTSLVEQDWTTIRTISHQVRGSCSHYGYPILEGYFEELEEHAMQDLPSPDQMKKQIDFIEQLKDSIGSGLTMTHR
ncbi:Hpt domain-containing response regulator [Pseudobacteriovorax antillogorgiicola]|uniref:CheY chemotaxis protein or a CheY-like REC (Receiver) domain n=1 Tax=Pseudobacteriovorax antillogorgiicola TaxID=1513793 RepID=A0A1Y6BYR8_9BACT|nr:response regulator [Pseudobacteriovorax antillogorgiicola]TCS53002.1 CheY-like chemotaxis protein [Pseudobacteriovorax antillogorgiicola]SMF27091.1 CheY chemotaxis protein or a CheY-like REC (receiver) domain [Pseudobacteriovorax antillogorgiicola]